MSFSALWHRSNNVNRSRSQSDCEDDDSEGDDKEVDGDADDDEDVDEGIDAKNGDEEEVDDVTDDDDDDEDLYGDDCLDPLPLGPVRRAAPADDEEGDVEEVSAGRLVEVKAEVG